MNWNQRFTLIMLILCFGALADAKGIIQPIILGIVTFVYAMLFLFAKSDSEKAIGKKYGKEEHDR